MRRERGDDGGLTPEAFLLSFFTVYQRCCLAANLACPAWTDLDEDEQIAWGDACTEARRLVEQTEEAPTSAATLAANVNMTFQRVRGLSVANFQPVPWAEIEPRMRLVWEALVRHTFNALVYDPDEDGSLVTHEERIVDDWLRPKLEALGQSEAEQVVAHEERDRAREVPHT